MDGIHPWPHCYRLADPVDTQKAPGEGGLAWQVARWTGLEPATPGVTGRYSNQLSYHRASR
jgi:hypothetical protein